MRAFQAMTTTAANVVPAEVLEVDEDGPHCTVKPVNGPELYEVRLRASLDGSNDGIWPVPAVGSWVLVTMIGGDDATAFVSSTSEVDTWVAKVGDRTFVMNGKETLYDGGHNEGLVIVGKLVDRLNALERAFNKLLAEYRVHVHVDPLTATTGPMNPPSVQQPVSLTRQASIENKNVKH